MIAPTAPEPLCDVAAQLRALSDVGNPKQAVWLAAGTALPDLDGFVTADFMAGVLVATNLSPAHRLWAAPTDETLAELLGYPEPKWSLVGKPVAVVQGRNHDDGVVIEMLSSVSGLRRAAKVALQYAPRLEMLTPEAALARRAELCRREGR